MSVAAAKARSFLSAHPILLALAVAGAVFVGFGGEVSVKIALPSPSIANATIDESSFASDEDTEQFGDVTRKTSCLLAAGEAMNAIAVLETGEAKAAVAYMLGRMRPECADLDLNAMLPQDAVDGIAALTGKVEGLDGEDAEVVIDGDDSEDESEMAGGAEQQNEEPEHSVCRPDGIEI